MGLPNFKEINFQVNSCSLISLESVSRDSRFDWPRLSGRHLPNTSVTILIRIDTDWDRYEMILLRIIVFSDHLKANFWNTQEPIIVYEVS